MVSRQVPSENSLTSAVDSPVGSAHSAGVGREAQRRRTRRALVEAARVLLTEGGSPPTIDAVAARADVSRRTVYTHFPTLDQLLLDAAVGALSEAYVNTALESSTHLDGPGDDVQARVAALVTAVLGLADATLPLGRQIIRLTVDRETTPNSAAQAIAPTRGSRRIAWIEAAISPLVERLTVEQHERLVSGLSMVIGFESMIVLRDVRGLDAAAEAKATLWAAHALVDAMVRELE